MKKKLFLTIKIPEGIEAELKGAVLTIKGPEGENKRTFEIPKLVFEKKGDEIIIGNEKATKREKKRMNTISAHIKNMIKGVQEKFKYELKACFSHFPFTVDIQGKEGSIKNFLGEKISRKVSIPEGVNVEVDKTVKDNKFSITISSINKELAGQAAANLEKATRIRMKDRRVFQDGIFIINKAGKQM
jgi:large subunit ribosomal protein L6